MLVTFHSQATSDVLMLDKHAEQVLQAAGRQLAADTLKRGVFTVEQLPAAIAALQAAIAAEAPAPQEDPDADPTHPLATHVSLKQRAYPLLDMMRQAQAQDVPVVWETGSAW